MLFKPLREKRIFGVKLPFTPGLIPKEKSRIAKSVGETIGKHLLSPEVIVKALCSEKISTQIYSYIEDSFKSYSEKEYKVKDLMEQFFNSHYESFRLKLQDIIYSSLYVQLVDDNNRNKIVKAVNDWISSKYNDFVKTEGYSKLKEGFADKLSKYLKSDELRSKASGLVESFINKLKEDDRSISEIIPEDALNEVKTYIFNHSGDIAKVLSELMNSVPLRDRLKFAAATMIEGTFGGFVSKLINPDSISEKIINAVQKYLDNPGNYNNIAAITNRALESLLENKVREFAYSISDETKKSTSNNITGAVINYLDNEDKRLKLVNEIEKAAGSLNMYEILDTVIINTLGNDEKTDDKNNSLRDLVENITEAIENIKLSSILNTMDENTVKSIGNILINAFGGFVKTKAGYIVELINIPEIVESEINSFDIEFAEKIIIDISKKELSAITWLGALLGGIMGLLTPLMQLIYK
jgi:uncharacterized membrane protein YheB (UPF0754 family)